MFCEFEACNMADDYWIECKHCGRRVDGFISAPSKVNGIGIQCQEREKKSKPSEFLNVSWAGVVESIVENTFSAKLIDKSDKTTYEIADFEFDEVACDERELILIGAIFVWTVSNINLNNGVRISTSVLRFIKP